MTKVKVLVVIIDSENETKNNKTIKLYSLILIMIVLRDIHLHLILSHTITKKLLLIKQIIYIKIIHSIFLKLGERTEEEKVCSKLLTKYSSSYCFGIKLLNPTSPSQIFGKQFIKRKTTYYSGRW